TVFNPTAASLQLKDANGVLVTGLSVGEATGTHFLNREGGLDLTNASLGHSLRLDIITPLPTQTNELLGPGGVSLREISPPTGDGLSAASAKGGAFGFGAVSVPTAKATFNAKIQAYDAAQSLIAVGDVSITSHSAGSVSSFADAKGGGFVGVGS